MTCNCTPENHRSEWNRDNDDWWEGEEHEECWQDHDWHCQNCAGSGRDWRTANCGCCSEEVQCDSCGGTGVDNEE